MIITLTRQVSELITKLNANAELDGDTPRYKYKNRYIFKYAGTYKTWFGQEKEDWEEIGQIGSHNDCIMCSDKDLLEFLENTITMPESDTIKFYLSHAENWF